MVKAIVSQTDPLLSALSLTERSRQEEKIYFFFFFSDLRFLKESQVKSITKPLICYQRANKK